VCGPLLPLVAMPRQKKPFPTPRDPVDKEDKGTDGSCTPDLTEGVANGVIVQESSLNGSVCQDKVCEPAIFVRFDIHRTLYDIALTGLTAPFNEPKTSSSWARNWAAGYPFILALARMMDIEVHNDFLRLAGKMDGLSLEPSRCERDAMAWIDYAKSSRAPSLTSKSGSSNPVANLLFRGVTSLASDIGKLRLRARNMDGTAEGPYAAMTKCENVCSHLIYVRHMVNGTGGSGLSVAYYLFSMIVGVQTGRWAWSAPELTGLRGEGNSVFGTQPYHTKCEVKAAMGALARAGLLPELKLCSELNSLASFVPTNNLRDTNPVISGLCNKIVDRVVHYVVLSPPPLSSPVMKRHFVPKAPGREVGRVK